MQLATQVLLERWTLAKPFAIARGVKTGADVVVVECRDGEALGRGESCPTAHYGESADAVLRLVSKTLDRLQRGASWDELHDSVPPGAARNAIDCALWDLRAKRARLRVFDLLGLPEPQAVETVYTLGLDAPQAMAQAAASGIVNRTLKLKLGAPGDVERVTAVRDAVPGKRLIVDVNEGWSFSQLEANLPRLATLGVELVEQPLRAAEDAVLERIPKAQRPIPIGADESCHTSADADRCAALYDVVNIKLDKTGGLTEALRLLDAAQQRGLQTMVGCMLGTSLAMAPAHLVAQRCRFVDLDAPLLMGQDREPALCYADGRIAPPEAALWG